MNGKKVALGLSGGVDSSVAAALLREAGYQVTGVYLECWREANCRGTQDHQDALAVAVQLQLPFQALDFKDAYQKQVLDYLYRTYESGATPNPDLLCNREIKFGLFYQWAMDNGFDYVATGHYAQVKEGHLYTSVDERKDQTYFLALVGEAVWSKVLFPVGGMTKQRVRTLAKTKRLPTATKKDSTGICFVGEVGMRDFLRPQIPPLPGKIVRFEGGEKKIVGTHQGLAYYTIGQRRGLQLTQANPNSPALYVKGKNRDTGELIVGEKEELMTSEFFFQPQNLNLLGVKQALREKRLYVRIRHQGELILVSDLQDQRVQLDKPVFAPAPGQFSVFYARDLSEPAGYFCLGAGEICE